MTREYYIQMLNTNKITDKFIYECYVDQCKTNTLSMSEFMIYINLRLIKANMSLNSLAVYLVDFYNKQFEVCSVSKENIILKYY